jgi:hypothetical protein
MKTSEYDGPEFEATFVVEFATREGKRSERYATYEEALSRLAQVSAEDLVSLPLIFRELADGSERAVREDGKPLQFHRVLVEDLPAEDDAPLPLAEGESGLRGPDGQLRMVDPRTTDRDEPLPPAPGPEG